MRILLASFISLLSVVSVQAAGFEDRDFGDWKAVYRVDQFNPSVFDCQVGTVAETATGEYHTIKMYINEKALASNGQLLEGMVAYFSVWDSSRELWQQSSEILRWMPSEDWNLPSDVQVKIDGEVTTFGDPNIIDKLKGKVEMIFRYQAHMLENQPIKTATASLIGFTQAWNYAEANCN